MSLQTIKEDLLYRLLPEGVLTLDQRGLMRALIGGYQERVADLRSYASKFELLYDPSADFPETGKDNVIQVSYVTEDSAQATRSLPVVYSTPLPTNYTSVGDGTYGSGLWSNAAIEWVSSETDIPVTSIDRVELTNDPLKTVDVNTLYYLAATVGAVLYKTPTTDPAVSLAEQRRVLYGYFPRLKIKGTAASFTVLGQLLTFSDVKMTPLWGRVSPRLPNDVGNAINDPDFKSSPESVPQQYFDVQYNPWNLVDGPFFSWASEALSTDRQAQNFYPQGVNGYNPFFTVTVSSTGSVYHPGWPNTSYPKTFTLAGGGPHTKASATVVTQSGSTVAEVKFWAIAEGDSFNGLQIVAPAPGSLLVNDERLSSVKFRTSYYDLALSTEFDRFVDAYGDLAVRKNRDLSPADGGDPLLCWDGTAVSPYRPWAGGIILTNGSVIVARHQASPSSGERQMDIEQLNEIGVQSSRYFEEVRAATRFPRHVLYGFLISDNAIYAAFPSREVLITAVGSTTPYGSGYASGFPLPPYTSVMTLEFPNGQGGYDIEIIHGAESDPNTNIVYYLHDRFSGWYDFDTAYFSGTFTGSIQDGQRWVARWSPTSTEIVRPEPDWSLKTQGSIIGYQGRAEDQFDDIQRLDMSENYPWRRDLTGAGEIVEPGNYLYQTSDVAIIPLKSTFTVVDQTGVEYDMLGIDAPSAASPLPIRYILRVAPLGQIGNKAVAVMSGDLYNVGSVNGVLVGDPLSFNNATHRNNLVGWFPLNQHPEDEKVILDHSKTNSDVQVDGVVSSDRKWDSNRGWVLEMSTGDAFMSDAPRDFGSQVTVSFWVKPSVIPVGPQATVVQLGSTRVLSGNIIAGKAYRVRGAGTVTYDNIVYPYTDISGVVDGFIGVEGESTFATAGDAYVIRTTSDSDDLNATPVISIDYSSPAGLIFYARSGSIRQAFYSAGIASNAWSFVSLSQSGTNFTVGVGPILGAGTIYAVSGQNSFRGFNTEDTFIRFAGTIGPIAWSDVRLWNTFKHAGSLDAQIRTYPYKKSALSMSPTYFTTLNRGEKWPLNMLPTGWVTPAYTDTPVEIPSMARYSALASGGVADIYGVLHYPPIPYHVTARHNDVVTTDNGLGGLNATSSILFGAIDYASGSIHVQLSGSGTQTLQVDYLRYSYDVNRDNLAQVIRYDGDGQYHGDSKFEEVGLGEGQMFVAPWRLGQQIDVVQSSGSLVVSTMHSALPGVNAVWSGTVFGSYYEVKPPYTNSGGVTTFRGAGTNSPWPNLVPYENAIRQRAWVKGDNGYTYEITLEDVGSGANLRADLVARRRSPLELLNMSGSLNDDQRDSLVYQELIAGNQVSVATTTASVSVRESIGAPHQGSRAGIDTLIAPTSPTPPSYKGNVRLLFTTSESLEAYDRVVLTITSAVAGLQPGNYFGEVVRQLTQASWLDGSTTVSGYEVIIRLAGLTPANFPGPRALVLSGANWSLSRAVNEVYAKTGTTEPLRPPLYLYLNQTRIFKAQGTQVYDYWDDPTVGATDTSYAWRPDAGILTFTNPGSIPAGNYIFTVDAGNIGQVDTGFTGFAVDVSIGDTLIPMRMVEDGAGYNPRGLTSVEVTLPSIDNPWPLVMEWTNDYDVPARGYKREFAVYGYWLERLETRAFRVDVTPFTRIDVTPGALDLHGFSRTFFKTNLSSSANTSGVTYNPIRDTLMVAKNGSPTSLWEYDMWGNQIRSITLTGWYDPEGVCWMHGTTYAVSEENVTAAPLQSKITIVRIPDGAVSLNHTTDIVASYNTGLAQANLGVEGVAYDAARDLIYFMTEKSSTGTSTSGTWNVWKIEASTGSISKHFDLVNLIGIPGYANDVADLHYDAVTGHFFLLAEDPLGGGGAGNYVIEVDYSGTTVLDILPVPEFTQPEGITMLPSRDVMYICGEPAQLARYDYTRPGGWVAQVNSSGSYANWTHESRKTPTLRDVDGEAGYTSVLPISALLTATTPHKRVSVIYSGTNPVLANPATPAGPSVSGVVVTSGTIYTP